MLSLHQLRCFLATLEHGSFTAAATALGYAQPSISEQVRLLEQQLDTTLFRRVGRGLVPTEAARALQPHASAALAAVAEAGRAVASVRELLTGTVRFGVFRTARFYLAADLVADVLQRHPGVRVELVGQNSAEVLEHLRKGRLEAAVIALPVEDENMVVTPVLRDELVYVSADPARLHARITPSDLASAQLVLPDASWRETDTTRRQLAQAVQRTGHPLRPRIEVEDTETALDIAARGLADTVTWRGVLHGLGDRLPAGLGWAPLRPAMYETFAVVHREGELSPASRVVVDLVTDRMRGLDRAMRARTA
ncbi:LysR family transcriptional regulator [Catellatospora methionotrophica]|uniref:LysR family transcriptional regulator n=1 Tax=Catellatospora methionotrophica TaxID=121620 RepID=A0A8J3PHN4_9ACTN|nr:LysR family transcriptional regulator [Catellatospora methionotrophica]GIG17552.1 LysR family transcriptional regulator [Catellatospora methionotrophica]